VSTQELDVSDLQSTKFATLQRLTDSDSELTKRLNVHVGTVQPSMDVYVGQTQPPARPEQAVDLFCTEQTDQTPRQVAQIRAILGMWKTVTLWTWSWLITEPSQVCLYLRIFKKTYPLT